MSALASLSILGSALLIYPSVWIVLRAVAGFAFAGAAMIVESWLAEASNSSNRGRVFGIYTMVLLGASTAGQLVLPLADTLTVFFFVVAAMLYSLSLVPTAISSSRAPQPLLRTRFDFPGLWRNSPLAVIGAFMVGVSNSTFGTLGAVYAGEQGLPLTVITYFVSMPVLAGAIAQMPIGWLSDRFDRRWVLAGVALVALMVDVAFVLVPPSSVGMLFAMASVFGIAIFAMYPVLVAHANDHANLEDALLTSGALLMVFGVGSMIGPTMAGGLMGTIGPRGLFATTLIAHAMLVGYTLWRMTRRQAVTRQQKDLFHAHAPATSTTPQTTAYRITTDELLAKEGVNLSD
jgi:MFS family permease